MPLHCEGSAASCSGAGDADSDGDGNGGRNGHGDGDGDGNGKGSGSGDGDENGNGKGNGKGSGSGDGDGDRDRDAAVEGGAEGGAATPPHPTGGHGMGHCYVCFDTDCLCEDEACELAVSPCACKQMKVHRCCLMTWAETSGRSRDYCSVCNQPFTRNFLCQRPFMKLKLLRHARGRAWVGPRVFTVGFGDRPESVLGRGLSSDIYIPDPTVSERHAKFSLMGRSVLVSDLHSSSGTYLLMKDTFPLIDKKCMYYFRMGKSLVSLKPRKKKKQGMAGFFNS